MHRRLEDQIRKLCHELQAQTDQKRIRKLAIELRTILRTYLDRLRKELAAYPVVQERPSQRR